MESLNRLFCLLPDLYYYKVDNWYLVHQISSFVHHPFPLLPYLYPIITESPIKKIPKKGMLSYLHGIVVKEII